MKKFNKKLPILFASLALAMGVGLVGSKDAVGVNAEESVKFSFSSGMSAAMTDGPITVSMSAYNTYTPLRIYANTTFTISTDSPTTKITKLVATATSNSYAGVAAEASYWSGTPTTGASGSVVTVEFSSSATTITFTPTAQTRWNDLTVYYSNFTDPTKTVKSVTGVGENYPTEIFVGDTIDGADVELNVLYDDGETGVELAHHVDVDSSVVANGVTATAYYDEEETMSATFTVDVLELPNTVALFESADVVSNSNYTEYSNEDWLLTYGGNNKSGGTNSKSSSGCKVDSKYIGDAEVSSSVLSFAIVSVNKLDNVGKLVFTYTGGSNYSNAKMYLTSSIDGESYSMVELTSGEQGMSVGSVNTDYVFEFNKIESAHYAVIIASTATSGDFRLDYIVAEFFAEPEKVNLVEQFISDWKEMRAGGTRGICDYDLNGTNALTDLLKRFEDFGEEDKALIRESIDVDDVTIGQTLDYINNVLKSEAAASEDNTLNSFIVSVSDNNTTSLVALFAVLGLVAVSAYYFIEKKKLAR
ncbi:MAG: hypothetical protein J1F31_06580 [Erysipelotrichales bacterium]|nr:hypothetical protein [Erysipelotrichales bacterium]